MATGKGFLPPTRRTGYDPHHNVGRALIDAAARLQAEADARARRLGVSGAQWTVLIRIGDGLGEGLAQTASQLCQSIGYDSGSMTRMLDRLEKLGLILREPSDCDGRALTLRLSPKGQDLYRDLSPIAVDVLDQALAGFTPGEEEQLIGFLDRLTAATTRQGQSESLHAPRTGMRPSLQT